MYSQFQPFFQQFLPRFSLFKPDFRPQNGFELFRIFSIGPCEKICREHSGDFSGDTGAFPFAEGPVQHFHRPYYYYCSIYYLLLLSVLRLPQSVRLK